MFHDSRTCLSLMLLVSVSITSVAEAQTAAKAPFDPSKAVNVGIGMPTPFDKFLALDDMMKTKKINWSEEYNASQTDLEPAKYSDDSVSIPALLGLRICDGIMAIKAKNAELLNQAAVDIEELARKAGAEESDLVAAKRVRAHANSEQWARVYLELGVLQRDIMRVIEAKAGSDGTAIVYASGWIHGAAYTSKVIEENYSEESSSILREPKLVEFLIQSLEKLPEKKRSSEIVTAIRETLAEAKPLITVPLNSGIPAADVNKLRLSSKECCKKIINFAR